MHKIKQTKDVIRYDSKYIRGKVLDVKTGRAGYKPKEKIRITRDVIKFALPYISGRVLDIGAGTAKYADIIKTKTQNYTTFDLIAGPNIDKVGDILDTGYDSKQFNTIICTQVFEHIPQPWLAIKEIERILKDDGVLILTTPFMQGYHADPHDYFRYTQEGLKFLCEKEGLKIVDSGGYGKVFFVIYDIFHLLFLNPYKKQNFWSKRLSLILEKIATFFDYFAKNKIIYASIFVIAKK